MVWCIVRTELDHNYGQDGDTVLDVIGPFVSREEAESLATRLHRTNADDASSYEESFGVFELMAAPTPVGRR